MPEKTPKKTPSKVDAKAIRELADILDETGLSEIEYATDEWQIRVARGGGYAPAPAAPAAPVAAAPAPAEAAKAEETDHAKHPGVVTSPMVGVAYFAPEPGAAPYIKVGDTVSEGSVILLIEAMKVYNQIKAPRSGKVTKMLVEDGTPVEFGEPLVIIE